ncbi:MAG: hypothetical protein KGI70_02930 [Patescibacteria group bacterium]|nr:hypothetical protein [Patescibacteria group bacterium]
MRRIIIFEHDGGELANQLWTYASVWAYALERGVMCENWSFFEYAHYFKNLLPDNALVRSIFFDSFKDFSGRRAAARPRFFRRLYKLAVALPLRASRAALYSREGQGGLYLLPPSAPAPETLRELEKGKTLFVAQVSGGMFRNPAGMEKYRHQLVDMFAPSLRTAARAEALLQPAHGTRAVGVHIRQGDYKVFKGGRYLIPHARVREIMEEYLRERSLSAAEVCFIICSDGLTDESAFAGLNVKVSKESAAVDLCALSRCEAILGSHSTFGNFAAWYGNIPHIVMQQGPIDWPYYAGKARYFENKYFEIIIR